MILIVLLIAIPLFIITYNFGTKTDVRIGYFADKVSDLSVDISSVSNVEFSIKNCRVYLLENTDSTTKIDIDISANRDTSISSDSSADPHTVTIHSDSSKPL